MSKLSYPDCKRTYSAEASLANHRAATHLNPAWVARKEHARAEANTAPQCPICGWPAHAIQTAHGLKHVCCGLHSWRGKPLADQATHDARKAAHSAFDPLWKSRGMSRGEAYRRLSLAMNMAPIDCHIGQMRAADARRVVEIVASGALAIDPTEPVP